MISVLKKDPPADLRYTRQAIRDRTQFTVPDVDTSGRHSVHRKNYFVQHGGVLVALYDKDAEQWFIDATQHELGKAWTAQLVLDAIGKENVIDVPHKQLVAIQRNGYVSVVRKRLNIKEKRR